MVHAGFLMRSLFRRLFLLVLVSLSVPAALSLGAEPVQPPVLPASPVEPAVAPEWVKVEFEPDAYYTSLGLYLALTKSPIPHVGEKSEKDLYLSLLSRAYAPRFLVIEGSVNPLPYAGTYIKKDHDAFYEDAQITGSFNWVQAVTAGFEEPYAASVFLGNIVDFSIPEDRKSKGIGYSGLLYSRGTYHIKSNTLVRDDWWEMEWKVKGDRKTQDRKLSWSFRFGAKLHGNPDITDIYYLSVRRSRLDYRPQGDSIFNNSGFEYTMDIERGTFTPIRHYFFVEKKWPLAGKKMAFALATGFVWESAKKYSGALAADHTGSQTQIILRPNIEF
jgi:hypothetical protein